MEDEVDGEGGRERWGRSLRRTELRSEQAKGARARRACPGRWGAVRAAASGGGSGQGCGSQELGIHPKGTTCPPKQGESGQWSPPG